jgi:parallel beta-helix repeat protein
MRTRALACSLVVGAFAACSSSSSSSPPAITSSSPLCTGPGRCIVISPSAKETDIDGAFATVKDGDTIVFDAGTYNFENQLALGTANNVTVIGAGMRQSILDFTNQKEGDDAFFVQSVNDFTMASLTIQNSPGNATRALAVTGLTYRSVEVTWAAAPSTTDGAYGLYPVQSSNVLIENCKISGASDSGIYVGQSQQIVVRNNEAFDNVAGIEIENSFFADVYGNNSHDNTGGILVFDLPGLMQEGGHNVRVYMNTITNNNTENFAAMGDIVSLVPGGTGFFVMANHDVEVFGNTITGNKTVAAGIISYALAQMAFTDPNYYEWPKNVYLHDNTYSGNGTLPDARNQVGILLATGTASYPTGTVPDVLYDGIVDPAVPTGPDPMMICIDEMMADAVCNMHFDQLDPNNPDITKTIVCGATPYACTLPALPAVSFPGLTEQ